MKKIGKKFSCLFLSCLFILLTAILPNSISKAETTELKSYNAVEAIKKAVTSGTLSSTSVWSYSERSITLNNSTGFYSAASDWIQRDILKVEKPTLITSGSLPNKLKDMLCVNETRGSDTKSGFAVDNDKIITFIGAKNGYAPSLTFTAPKTGTVRLYDPKSGQIGGAGKSDPYWTLSSEDKEIGIAIYLENKRIWPAKDDYYVLTNSVSTIKFPEIYADVEAGQRIRIEFIPLKNHNWGFCQASPQIDYHWIEPESQRSVYDAISEISAASQSGTLPYNSTWSYSERRIALNSETSLYEPDSLVWIDRNLVKVSAPTSANSADLKKKMADALCVNENRNSDTKNGFFIDNNEIFTYINCNNGYAPSLTFNVPKNGDIVLSQIGDTITAPGQGNLYWTLNNNTKKIGFAIFQNDEKIWPADNDYYVFTQSNRTLALPEIPLAVSKGDKIRFELVGLNHGWGFFKISPRVQYLTTDELITEFPAVRTIKNAEKAGYLAEDDVWCYSESPIAYEEGTGEFGYDGVWNGKYYPTGEWTEKALDQIAWRADLTQLSEVLPNRLYYKDSNTVFLGNGFASYKNQVCTYVGAYNMRASALTFNAPYSGMVNLYDPNSRNAGAALPDSVFSTLTSGVKTREIGFAIYLNEQKIWPENDDFCTLTSDKKTVLFPSISKIKVNKGDKLRVCFFSRKGHEQMGFCVASPQVDYTEVNSLNLSYNAADVLKSNAARDGEWTTFKDDFWGYQELQSAVHTVTYNGQQQSVVLPTVSEWNTPEVKITKTSSYCSMNGLVRSKIQNYMYWRWDGKAGDGRGISYYDNGIVMSVGTGVGNESLLSSAITYKAPLNGTISLFDPKGGTIGDSGIYTYDEYGGKIGLAVYKNDEKLWPSTNETNTIEGYYVLNDGINDKASASYIDSGNKSVDFPTLSDITVNSGDTIRIVAVPLDMKWKFIKLNPQIEYTAVNEPNWSDEAIALKITNLPEMRRYFTDENFDFSDLGVAVRRANGIFDTLTLNGSNPKYSYTITEPEKGVGVQQVTIAYNDGFYMYKTSFDIEIRYKKYADLNADGLVNAADLTCITKLLLGNTKGIHIGVADVNDDSEVNLLDAIRIKKYLSGIKVVLGPENQIPIEQSEALKNITVNAIGDSYFAGHLLGPDSTWLKIFSDKYNILLNNYGVNGSTISDYKTDKSPMCLRYSTMTDGADIVIFEGGHNDSSNWVPLGTADSTDSKTFAGAVNVLIKGLKQKYPNAMLIGLTSWYKDDYMKQYSDMMLSVCKLNGVPCINAADKILTGVDMSNDEFRKEYCQSETDHAHLNYKGSALVEPVFERIIAEEYYKFISDR